MTGPKLVCMQENYFSASFTEERLRVKNPHRLPVYVDYYSVLLASRGISNHRAEWGQVQTYISLFRLGCVIVCFKG